MSDIRIDIINPVRPYVLYKAEDDSIAAYLDTSNIDKGVRFFDRAVIENACACLKKWIKPLWDKWQNGYHRDWLIETPATLPLRPFTKEPTGLTDSILACCTL